MNFPRVNRFIQKNSLMTSWYLLIYGDGKIRFLSKRIEIVK